MPQEECKNCPVMQLQIKQLEGSVREMRADVSDIGEMKRTIQRLEASVNEFKAAANNTSPKVMVALIALGGTLATALSTFAGQVFVAYLGSK